MGACECEAHSSFDQDKVGSSDQSDAAQENVGAQQEHSTGEGSMAGPFSDLTNMPPLDIYGLPSARRFSDHYRIDRRASRTCVVTRKADGQQALVKMRDVPTLPSRDNVWEQSIREVGLLKGVEHPNIQRLLDVFCGSSAIYTVREIVGDHFRLFMSRASQAGNVALDLETIRCLFKQLLNGLEFCHSRRIICRLVPGNVFVDSSQDQPSLKLSGFGAARAFAVPVPPCSTHYDFEDQSCHAPELLLGAQEHSLPVDVWSAGCIFAEMVCGASLFGGPNVPAIETLFNIFKKLGTPMAETWHGLGHLPYWKSKFPKWKRKPWEEINDIAQRVGPDGVALLDELFHYDPRRRCSAKWALGQRWFSATGEGPVSGAVKRVSVLNQISKTSWLPVELQGELESFLYRYPNPQFVVEYSSVIDADLREKEKSASFAVNPDYMLEQVGINAQMRGLLVDWLIGVHSTVGLRRETLFLTVHLLDSFLQCKLVCRSQLQTIGIAAMSLAAKYEDESQWACMSHDLTTDETVKMEIEMLESTQQSLHAPTVAHFFARTSKANGCSDRPRHSFEQYLTEIALIDIEMLRHAPSCIAAAATLLSNRLFKRQQPWPRSMVLQTGYEESDLEHCVECLRKLLDGVSGFRGPQLNRKFSPDRYHYAGLIQSAIRENAVLKKEIV
jgi:serine/threonine protein kinase